jgi:hypothetical protein
VNNSLIEIPKISVNYFLPADAPLNSITGLTLYIIITGC